MSIFSMLFKNSAPVHSAERVLPTHDGLLHLVEARRGRGKSIGAVEIMASWIIERWEDITSGGSKYKNTKVYTNIHLNIKNFAYLLLKRGLKANINDIHDTLSRIIVHYTSWNEVLTSYDSLVIMDEANRNLDYYDRTGENARSMLVIHDWLQQTRKHRLTLYFFVQYLEWIKPQLRMLIDRLWRVKKVQKNGRISLFNWYGSDPFSRSTESLVRRADFKMSFRFSMWAAQSYDSWQAVETLSYEYIEFKSFQEIALHMEENGLKYKELPLRKDPMTYFEEMRWIESKRLLIAAFAGVT